MTRGELLGFLQKHRLGVVATTSSNGDPQSAVVGIAVTDQLEIVFDTLSTTRKCINLRKHPKISVVVGWDQEITVQYEGIADEPTGAELDRLKQIYFVVYPECMDHQSWDGITYFRIRPTWIRYSDFNPNGNIVEFSARDI
jgi:pyridoxine/pyridoxamine 5'-phosphate oxidase